LKGSIFMLIVILGLNNGTFTPLLTVLAPLHVLFTLSAITIR
jgi:hypothetical protein